MSVLPVILYKCEEFLYTCDAQFCLRQIKLGLYIIYNKKHKKISYIEINTKLMISEMMQNHKVLAISK